VSSATARTRRSVSLIVALALAIAVIASAGHSHEQHHSNDVACAVCAVAHHSPAIATVTALSAPPLLRLSITVACDEKQAFGHEHDRESGRAPPQRIAA
jgi:hypothetical protein